MPTPEREMLVRVAEGDPEARAWLYDRFAPGLFRRLARRYPDLDAEELLHDAFLGYLREDSAVLRRALERLPAEATTAARVERLLWDHACGIATNQRRSYAHRKVVPLHDRPRRDPSSDPEASSLARDQLRRLDGCLQSAGERVYLYFQLRFVDGLKPREITAAMGWPARATYKLKEALDGALRRCAERLGLNLSD